MNKKNPYLLWILGTLIFTSSLVKAQDVINGVIKDESGQGLSLLEYNASIKSDKLVLVDLAQDIAAAAKNWPRLLKP